MKNNIIILIIILVFILMSYGAYKIHDNANFNFKRISADTLLKKVELKDTFILYIGGDTLEDDIKFQKIYRLVLDKYNIISYYVNVSGITNEDFSKILSVVEITNTPAVAFIENGVETNKLNRIIGYTSDEETEAIIINKLTDAGYIK